ncbi:tRNA 2-thiouridine(34) synthase MnmA [Pseudoxanthomonas winnipegensis]|uniref:tRNA 2-thiouridine(34) synthase MnmA n=1 Tax=Pseudoxanthomonas winnipegensis TaxID=2480810 RepID=UPI0025782035|nr:tRNA 2-thiouridine(34) synthase MnmA [Pseudoxanthomonas winnipegensis]WJI17412.1 tRNA 2-thiouridine(34) synthase MnmA [Pseudoxanthomonas winnipegensis]
MSATPRVVVGVSGGVDSSVAALQLVQAGEPVAGLFMQNWADDDAGQGQDNAGGCRAEEDRRDAVAVCGRLGIPFHFRDFSREYWDGVFAHFLAEYAAGRTPNPDVLCNREVKFKHFIDAARALGAEKIATGHYARVEQRGRRWHLLRGVDTAKDQSYFLHQLGQEQLSATLFPVGHLHKPDLRGLARQAGLPVHDKKDSTGICFIGERDFRQFLGQYLPARTGEMRDPDGVVIGQHPGVFFFTLGQREGLNIGGVRGRPAAPWYVVGKDVASNVLYVDQDSASPYLQSTRLRSEAMHWVAGSPPAARFDCHAQTRYRQAAQPCTVHVLEDGTLDIQFAHPQRAVTPGQSVVLYDGDDCLGGAVIDRTDAPLELRLRERAA